MKYLNSKEVASIMGVNVSTIKRWTDSGDLDCYQTVGGHRKFILSHIKSFLKKNSSQKLTLNIIEYLNKGDKELVQRIDKIDYKYLRAHVLQLSLEQNVDSIHEIINSLLIKGETQHRIYDELILNILNKIGVLWTENKFSISDEHIITVTIKNVLYKTHSDLAENDMITPWKTICMTLTGDEHEIPLVMIQSILRGLNISNINLGVNLPVTEIESKIEALNLTHIVVSTNYILSLDIFISEISQLIQYCHKKNVKILIGGIGYDLLNEENRNNTIGLKNMTELYNYFKVDMES